MFLFTLWGRMLKMKAKFSGKCIVSVFYCEIYFNYNYYCCKMRTINNFKAYFAINLLQEILAIWMPENITVTYPVFLTVYKPFFTWYNV